MELDAKQKVLIAIYMEYQKDLPDMKNNIKADMLGLERDVFKIALEKLYNERLIIDVKLTYGGNERVPIMAYTDDIKMTPYGIQYVEEKLKIERTLTGKEKVEGFFKNAASWGWEQLKDIAAKTLAEMSKQ